MDTTELNLDPTKTPDVGEEGLLEADRAREMLFDEILEQLAVCDLFSNPAHAPTIFPVYAHQNDAVGVSHENCVHDLIRWLQKIKARILSDKSALPPLVSKQENTSAQRNILANQIRLLPTGKSANPGEASTTIDKVIVCASDVLERYCETENAKDYIEKIRHLCILNDDQSIDSIEARVREVVEGETSKHDFHHVLTELAFLQVRKSRLSGGHGLVPVALNGDHKVPYLSFFGSTDLILKLESPTPPALHKVFFKLLEQLFEEEKNLVKECKKCYDEVVKELNLESGEPLSRKSFHNCLSPKITKMYHNHWGVFSTAMRNDKYVAYAGKFGNQTFQIVDELQEKERLEILRWISPTGAASMHGKYQDTHTKRLDGTCDWVVHHEAFQTWHSSQEPTILCLSGSMGTGKTYTTSRVIDWIGSSLEGSEYDEAFAYFYCIKQEESRRNPTSILRSLVRQVASGPWNRRHDNIALDEPIMEMWGEHLKDKFYDTFDDWKDCFFSLLSKYPRTTIVLDALDECVENDRQILVKLFDALNTRSSDESLIKIFVATRPESDLKEWLECHHSILMQQRMAGDIATFLRSKIEQHTRWSKSTRDFKEYVIDTLSSKSQDMFLYASLQIEILLDCKLKDDIRDALNELPEDLNAAYKDIYETATKRKAEKKFVDRALQWVLCSAEPLTSHDLLFAICQDPNADAIASTDPEVNEDLLLGLCHNLLRLDTSRVYSRNIGARVWRLAHQAVAEFFEKSGPSSQTAAHSEIGQVCLMVLLDALGGNPVEDDSRTNDGAETITDYECPCRQNLRPYEHLRLRVEGRHIPFKMPLMEYANYAWPTHVRAEEQRDARSVDRLSQMLQKFLGEPGKGSLVYNRWVEHSFHARFHDAPSWSIFADRGMPGFFGLEPMMAPLSLACYLGLRTALAGWWDSPHLELNIRYCNESFLPWSDHPWSLPNDRPLKWSLVALACAHNEAEIYRCLVDRGAEFHTIEEDEVPPIVAATIGDSEEMVSELICLVADMPSPLESWHEHILACAIKCNSLKAMGPLMDWLPSEPDELKEVLASINMSEILSANAITILLKRGVDVNVPVRDGTLLATAAYHQWEHLVRRLLNDGADVNKQFYQPESRRPRFHNALEVSLYKKRNLRISRLLIEHGARVSAWAVGITCQQYRFHNYSNWNAILRFLLRKIPDPNETWTGRSGRVSCALIEMLRFGIVDHVHLLIERGAVVYPWVGGEEVDTLSFVFETVLSYDRDGWRYPTGEMIEALVGAGASFEHLREDRRNSAIVAAAGDGLKGTVQDLLKCGANPNAFVEHKYPTALVAAAASGHHQAPDVIRVLLDGGADVNTYLPETIGRTSLSGRTALDFPLWYLLSEILLWKEPNARQAERRETWFRSASLLLENGAIWDIDFAQWRRRLENTGPEFALHNGPALDSLQNYWSMNRNSDPRTAFDERWKIKDPNSRDFHKRGILFWIGNNLRRMRHRGPQQRTTV